MLILPLRHFYAMENEMNINIQINYIIKLVFSQGENGFF